MNEDDNDLVEWLPLFPALRPYQVRVMSELFIWLKSNQGNPVIEMPTGSGKSWIIAEFCRYSLQNWPQTRVLMLTHVKELIEQNHDKLLQVWSDAPVGIYSAGLDSKVNDKQITFAGVQSMHRAINLFQPFNVIMIDECHLVNHKDKGIYRKIINYFKAKNPRLRIIGLTATPYRLGHGLIYEGSQSIFNGLINPVSIAQLIELKYLAVLRSKCTDFQYDVSKVKVKGGEYVEHELQKAVDTQPQNEKVANEIIARAEDRKAWLIFCPGVDHAHHMQQTLQDKGINTKCITGDTPKDERKHILTEFKAGNIRAITNANVLTTGFDYADIDLLVFTRPTKSMSLYIQMAGRGMRLKSHTDHCLVLDFAGLITTHGPVTAPGVDIIKCPMCSVANVESEHHCVGCGFDLTQKQCPVCKVWASDMTYECECGHLFSDVKKCPDCGLIYKCTVTKCACGYDFTTKQSAPKNERKLGVDLNTKQDIMGFEPTTLRVQDWKWSPHTSKAGNEMLKCRYMGGHYLQSVTEWLSVLATGFALRNAMRRINEVAKATGVKLPPIELANIPDICKMLNEAFPPHSIDYIMEKGFPKITNIQWEPLDDSEYGEDVTPEPISEWASKPVAPTVLVEKNCTTCANTVGCEDYDPEFKPLLGYVCPDWTQDKIEF